MRTTIDLPDDLYRNLKAEAALRGLKLKELVQRALEQALSGGSGGVTGPASRRVRLPLIKSRRPGTLEIDGDLIAAVEEAEEGEIHGKSVRR